MNARGPHAVSEGSGRRVKSDTFPIRISDNSFHNKNKLEYTPAYQHGQPGTRIYGNPGSNGTVSDGVGGLYLAAGGSATIENTTISENQATTSDRNVLSRWIRSRIRRQPRARAGRSIEGQPGRHVLVKPQDPGDTLGLQPIRVSPREVTS